MGDESPLLTTNVIYRRSPGHVNSLSFGNILHESMPLQSRGVTIAVKIPPPTCLCRTELIAPEKIIQQSLPQPGQFMEAAAMPGIIDRQGEKLQGSLERHAAVLGIVLMAPVQGPFDLASDIGELFHQRKFPPAPGGQLPMLNNQDRTLLPTT